MGLRAVTLITVVCCGVGIAQYQSQYQAPYQQNNYQQNNYQKKNYSSPYGNYSGGGSAYGNYAPPQYPPQQYNQSAKYVNASLAAYNGDPFAWSWDHLHTSRHVYDQAAQDWIYGNFGPAWEYGVAQYEGQNNQYSGYGQTCGYTGNPYNTIETRNAKRAGILVFVAEWLWNNYPDNDKKKLHHAMLNIDASKLNIYGLNDCLAENYQQWQGTCDQYQKYSRPDQICNNIQYPTWGAWLDIGERITNIWNYELGIWQPQFYNVWPGYDGTIAPLIDAKVLADALDNNNYGQCYNLDVTMLHAYWTQYITHDIIKSAPYTVTAYNGQQVKPECCQTPDNCLHHACAPLKGQTVNGYNSYPWCQEFSYNLPGIDYCTPLPKDPTNLQTSYIDSSQLYGASCYDAAKVRSFRKGKLRVNKGQYGLYAKNVLLPEDPLPDTDECDTSYPDASLKCLLSGDRRNNQHPGLLVLHTLMLRLHNRISSSCAKWLERYYLSDDVLDEICYQETRRTIQALSQNIFYRDHLPVELGPYLTSNPNYGLGLDYVLPYDPAAHASVWPEYTYIGGRLHTVISHWSQMKDDTKVQMGLQEPDSWYGIYDFFHKAYGALYSKHKLNELVSNSIYDPEQCYDTDFVPELRNLNPQYGGAGADMFWINIMRGREFGSPWYSQLREFCGLGYLDDWSQLQGVWNQNCLNTLPGLLYHVKNVEGYVGLICENPLPGAIVGPTAACILQRQYYNLREGDRFFFDRNGWTYDQLAVIKKFNLGKIICITTNLDYVTENVFRTPNPYSNKYQSCNAYDDITEDDLSVIWSTIPYAAGDYRTCKEYGGYASAPYQNGTYSNQTSYSQPAYQQPAYQQPAYQQPAYQAPAPVYQAPAYQAPAPAYQAPVYQQPAAYQKPGYQQAPYSG
jgi:peroxidase